MAVARALRNGLVGATTLTVVHEAARKLAPNAPRADRLGMQGIERGLKAADIKVPPKGQLRMMALAGDIAGNALYYSFVGSRGGRGAWTRGVLLGGLAGVGALLLPSRLGMSKRATNATRETQIMTVAWYLLAGIAAAAISDLFSGRSSEEMRATEEWEAWERAEHPEEV